MSSGDSPQLPGEGLWVPSEQETEEAIEAIKQGRAEQPAAILQRLAVAVIKAVTEIDQVFNAGRYLQSITIICKGPGNFELQIVDKNCEDDPAMIARAVAAELDVDGHLGYYKPLRQIDVGFETEEKKDGEGATGPPPNAIP